MTAGARGLSRRLRALGADLAGLWQLPLWLLLGGLCGFLAARLYALRPLPTLAATLLFLPFGLLLREPARRRRAAREHFHRLIAYMEQLIYLFRRRPKIQNALRTMEETLPEDMTELLDEMLRTLEDRGPEAAFGLMEQEYPLRELAQLHRFLIRVETLGGECDSGLDLLLTQTRALARREEAFRNELDRVRRRALLCVGLSAGIGAVTVRLMPAGFGITALPLYQGVSLAALVLYLLLFVGLQWGFAGAWGQPPRPMAEEEVRRRKALATAPLSLGSKRLLLTLVLLCLLALAALETGSRPAALGTAFLFLWEMSGPWRRKRRSLRRLKEEARRQFPTWLRELAVYLQTQTVPAALSASAREAEPLMKVYLEELNRALREDPVTVGPYRRFMAELALPEVRDAMILLYSLNVLGRRQAQEQLTALVRRNEELNEKNEERYREETAAALGFTVALPMAVAVLHMLADMSLMLLHFLQG